MSVTPPIQSSLSPQIAALTDAIKDVEKNQPSFADAMNAAKQSENPLGGNEALSEKEKTDLKNLHQRLSKAGQEFEALFFSMMLKEMRKSISSEEGAGLFAGEGSDTYGGMFDTFIGQHMASGGPLGIANTVESYLQKQLPEPMQEILKTTPKVNGTEPADSK